MRSRFLLRSLTTPLLIGIAGAVVVRLFVLQFFAIPSASMAPTLLPGEQVAVTPYSAPWRSEPARGDVVVFRSVDRPGEFLVKRVIALPGDHVEIRRGFVRLNGRALAEPYLASRSGNADVPPEIVPAGCVWVLGDNRGDSADSRRWGFLPREQIVGRARVTLPGGRVAAPQAEAAERRQGSLREPAGWRPLTLVR
jgi:signal peptidase I